MVQFKIVSGQENLGIQYIVDEEEIGENFVGDFPL